MQPALAAIGAHVFEKSPPAENNTISRLLKDDSSTTLHENLLLSNDSLDS